MIPTVPPIPGLPLGGAREICQVCLVVDDIEASSKKYAEIFGVPMPPIRTLSEKGKSLTTYRGQTMTGGFTQTCFYFRDDYGFELICPDEKPSFWRECLDRFGEGVNHVAFDVPDLDSAIEAMEKLGYKVIQRGLFEKGNGGYAYLDTFADFKVYIELLMHTHRKPFGSELFGAPVL